MRLLTARIGAARAAADPAAVAEIAGLCAHLPLALAIAAAEAAARPGIPLAALAAELRDAAGRLDALDAGEAAASVRAAFSWSYSQLSAAAARMFRLLGLHPGPDITAPAAASLAATTEPEARRLLRDLARAHLITERVPGRYAFHDLLRAYAATRAREDDGEPEREAAIGRLLDHYLHSASHCADALESAQEPVPLTPPAPGTAPERPADHRSALAWFDAEHQVLLAAVALAAESGFGRHAWQLPWAMSTSLAARGNYQQLATAQRAALAAATRLGDIHGQAVSGRLLANALTHLGDYDQARSHYEHCLGLYRRLGDRLGQAKVHHNLAYLAELQRRYADALRHDGEALRLYQAIGDKTGEAVTINGMGWYHGLLGDYEQARAASRQALSLCAETGFRRLEGFSWDSLGYAEHHLGNLGEAAACYQRAIGIVREFGDRHSVAVVLTHLGDTHQSSGEQSQAREAWQQALAILDDLHHPEAEDVRAKLASIGG